MIKRSTENETKGGAKDLKGRIKEGVGRAMNRPDIEDEGTADRAEGKIQKKVGQVQKVFEK
ncbi:MAG: CsbD family protein [Limisphaerales bacterium]